MRLHWRFLINSCLWIIPSLIHFVICSQLVNFFETLSFCFLLSYIVCYIFKIAWLYKLIIYVPAPENSMLYSLLIILHILFWNFLHFRLEPIIHLIESGLVLEIFNRIELFIFHGKNSNAFISQQRIKYQSSLILVRYIGPANFLSVHVSAFHCRAKGPISQQYCFVTFW